MLKVLSGWRRWTGLLTVLVLVATVTPAAAQEPSPSDVGESQGLSVLPDDATPQPPSDRPVLGGRVGPDLGSAMALPALESTPVPVRVPELVEGFFDFEPPLGDDPWEREDGESGGFDADESVELVGERDHDRKVFLNPDGRRVAC